MNIKHRDPFFVVIVSILTLGIYFIYWIVATKKEIMSLGATTIPTVWLVVVPIVNFYFLYRYMEAFSSYVKKDNNPILWFTFWLVIPPVAVFIMQLELNKLAQVK